MLVFMDLQQPKLICLSEALTSAQCTIPPLWQVVQCMGLSQAQQLSAAIVVLLGWRFASKNVNIQLFPGKTTIRWYL